MQPNNQTDLLNKILLLRFAMLTYFILSETKILLWQCLLFINRCSWIKQAVTLLFWIKYIRQTFKRSLLDYLCYGIIKGIVFTWVVVTQTIHQQSSNAGTYIQYSNKSPIVCTYDIKMPFQYYSIVLSSIWEPTRWCSTCK